MNKVRIYGVWGGVLGGPAQGRLFSILWLQLPPAFKGFGALSCGSIETCSSGVKKRHLVRSRWLARGLMASKGVSSPFSLNP